MDWELVGWARTLTGAAPGAAILEVEKLSAL